MSVYDEREYHRIYRESHKEKQRFYDKKRHEKFKNNPDFITRNKLYAKKWYESRKNNSAFKEHRRAYRKIYRSNPEIRERDKLYRKKRYDLLREDIRETAKKYYHSHKNDVGYKERKRAYHHKYYRLKKDELLRKQHIQHLNAKIKAFEILGSKCIRCGFSDSRALQIDHVKGNGSEERKNGHSTYRAYLEIIVNPTTMEYQLLCANCNWIKDYSEGKRTQIENEYRQNKKLEAYSILGNKCKSCGLTDIQALQIDHVKGGGVREKRMRNVNNIQIYVHIIRNPNQTKYQLLCANCNWIKAYTGKERPSSSNKSQNLVSPIVCSS